MGDINVGWLGQCVGSGHGFICFAWSSSLSLLLPTLLEPFSGAARNEYASVQCRSGYHMYSHDQAGVSSVCRISISRHGVYSIFYLLWKRSYFCILLLVDICMFSFPLGTAFLGFNTYIFFCNAPDIF